MDSTQTKDYADAIAEIGKTIAIGSVPYLGQGIDLYDTLESIWRLNASNKQSDKDEAKFDLVLAIIGWIPGPGDGVKKTFRLVNKEPQRFAPIFFDILRQILITCGVKTSPEALLSELLNVGKLKSQLAEIKEAIEDATLYEELSPQNKRYVQIALNMLQAELPALIGIVERKVLHWKKIQPNNSALQGTKGKAETKQPAKKDAHLGEEGHDRPSTTSSNSVRNDLVATAKAELENSVLGVMGEHIADYYCLEHYGWGKKNWSGHDKGTAGAWKLEPGKVNEGKLSNKGKLFKLGDTANGTGIDAVWRANSHNEGKLYAIVEAKASKSQSKPQYIKTDPSRKPSISRRLGVNGIPKAEEILDPPTEEAGSQPAANTVQKGNGGKKKGAKNQSGTANTPTKAPASNKAEIIVQMSHEWIKKNLLAAVGRILEAEISRPTVKGKAYSRHLFYTPLWSPTALKHSEAYLQNKNAAEHADHDLLPQLCYGEDQVRLAVNSKKESLRKKFGNLSSLKAE